MKMRMKLVRSGLGRVAEVDARRVDSVDSQRASSLAQRVTKGIWVRDAGGAAGGRGFAGGL